ncbi:MAG: class IV adenylate cyclase [Anaerolineales bacterium]|nr:MAG: class IV adenylate cyclase [Anaerolineales bacterium]
MTDSGHELEVKFLLSNLPALQARLQDLGAHLVHERVYEINLRFDTPDEALRRSSQVLRLRQDHEVRITYKGPSQSKAGVLMRREIEFTVGDYQAALDLLDALGYQVLVMYEKYRTTYAWSGVHILLDELPYGDFVEVEGSQPDMIRLVSNRLKLDWGCRILDSYTQIFDKLRHIQGFTFRDLSFANFSDLVVDLGALGINPADQ